jgi:uncharacterized glyoxalase superfamily protein PhnB/uncharacterized protein YndB with AHSA1/START domain
MTAKTKLDFKKDLANKKIHVIRHFDAAPDLVWRAWTERELLDEWWAPEPWKAETKEMDFREGGHWLYAMVSPEGSKHWDMVQYTRIVAGERIESYDFFSDENGKRQENLPGMTWLTTFHKTAEGTKVVVELTFESVADLEKIVEMGFREGFTSTLDSLDHYLAVGFKIRKEMKKDNKARVTTYLNFPGKTEEAFHFYKKVFKGEFTGKKLTRFGDIELPAEHPPMSDADKKLIIHAELTILGGHVLMATDAPENMGFKLEHGNNMHINLEPDSRQETERLFRELSDGGNVSMPLSDMFWGAYFASFTDKYGINWMLNYQE